jgi:predicted aspartyl protease
MPIVTGFFKDFTPHAKVKIWGGARENAREFDAIIDTGFNGFISMPSELALGVGLAANITTTVTHADGNDYAGKSGVAWAAFSDQERCEVVIVYDASADVLLGMKFLEVFRLGLIILDQRLWLVPMAEFTGPQIHLP